MFFGFQMPDLENATPDQIARHREAIAMMMPRFGDAQYIGEGIGQLATGIKMGRDRRKLEEAQAERRSSFDQRFRDTIAGRASADIGTMSTPLAPPSGGAGVSGGAGGDMAAAVRAGLIERGMPPHVAEAFILNFQDESGLNPGINERNPIVPGSRGGFGLAQWTGPRRRQLEAFAAERGVPVSDLDMQLDFLMTELGGSEARAARNILSAGDTAQAAVAIVNDFLRPAEQHRRSRTARYSNYSGGPPASTASTQTMPSMPSMPAMPAMPAYSGPPLEELYALAADPWATPEQRAVVGQMIQQAQQAQDPTRALDMQRARLELAQAQQELSQSGQPQFQTFTGEEASALGLDPRGVYQRTQSGITTLQQPPEEGGGDMTESERRIYMFSQMQSNVGPAVNRIEDNAFDPANFRDRFAEGVVGGNFLTSPEGRRYNAAAMAWAEGALRLATGAAATPEEAERIISTYFARAGDDAETIAFKRAMRENYQNVIEATLQGDINAEIPNPLLALPDELYGTKPPGEMTDEELQAEIARQAAEGRR